MTGLAGAADYYADPEYPILWYPWKHGGWLVIVGLRCHRLVEFDR